MEEKTVLTADVAVVGSGLSGLTTTYRLTKYGLKVVLVEATDQIGGRTRSLKTKDGQLISYGGTWSTFDDSSTLGLANEIQCFPFLPEIKLQINELQNLILHPYIVIKLWLLGRQISMLDEDYTNSDLSKKYDNITLAEWLESQDGFLDNKCSRKAVLDYLYAIESYSLDPNNMSCLFAAIVIYKRISKLTSTGFPMQKNLRWEGGTGVFVSKLKDCIYENGGADFLTNQPVYSIDQTDGGAVIETTNYKIQSKTVVVSTSLPSAFNIKYSPGLPAQYQKLFSSILPWNDPALNLILIFKTHFLAGALPLPNYRFPTKEVIGPIFDLTPMNSNKGFYRLLCNPDFVSDLDKDQIKDSALKLFVSFYPEEEHNILTLFEDMIIVNWLDQKPWIPAVAYYYPPMVLSQYGSFMRKPFGNIHWGGSERAVNGLHWIEGAIDRGNEVAGEVLLNLGKISSKQEYYIDIDESKAKGINHIRSSDNILNIQNFIYTVKSTLSSIFFHHDHHDKCFRTTDLSSEEKSLLNEVNLLD